MRISTRGEYGLRAILVLARHHGGQPMPLREIATIEGISEQYLEQLFRELKKAGLVESHRGARGGYVLSDMPEDIGIGSVIRALEGPIEPMQCVTDSGTDHCCRDNCATKVLWQKLKFAIDHVLDSTTLADLLGEAAEKE